MYTKIRPTYHANMQSYDPRLMEHMTYRNQISDPVPQHDPEIAYDYDRSFIFISSSSRDRTRYPDPAHFKINIPTCRDVVSVELAAGVLPNQGGIHGDGYVLLEIPDLNHISNTSGNDFFGILGLVYHPNAGYFNVDKSNVATMACTFRPTPKARLDSIEIIMRHPDGTQVLFGDEDPLAPANLANQLGFTFEIRTRVKRVAGIERDVRAPVPII